MIKVKRNSFILMGILMLFVIFAGCVKQPQPPLTKPSKTEKTSQKAEKDSEAVPAPDESWKPAMKAEVVKAMAEFWDFVMSSGTFSEDDLSEDEYYAGSIFQLAYIDDDDIPEIFVGPYGWGALGTGSCVLYMKDGNVEKREISWCDTLEYIPRSDKVNSKHGQHVPYQESVYVWSTGEGLGWGAFYYPGWVDGEDHSFNGEEFEYRWEDVSVPESEYNAKKAEVYSGESVLLGEGESYGYAEILACLNTASDESVSENLSEDTALSYLNIVLNDPDKLNDKRAGSVLKYGLLYINDDDLPELVVHRFQPQSQFGTEDITIYTYEGDAAGAVPIKRVSGGISWDKQYFEKKDYILANYCKEDIADDSEATEYCPVFNHENPNYIKWNYDYPLGYKTQKQEDYDKRYTKIECSKDNTTISEAEYESGVKALNLGEGKNFVDECVSYAEIIAKLSSYIGSDRVDKIKR